MTRIAVSAPEGHLWHGRHIHVCGAAAGAVLTMYGTFSWCPIGKRWAWICDREVTLAWPGPESAEHAALVASFAGPALVPRQVEAG